MEVVLQQARVLFEHFFAQGVEFFLSNDFLVTKDYIVCKVLIKVFLDEQSFLGFPFFHIFRRVFFELILDRSIVARIVDLGLKLFFGGFDVISQFQSEFHHGFLGIQNFLLIRALTHKSS